MFEPICNQNELICGEGNSAIVTGWSDPQVVKESDINEQDYAVIGPLRSCHQGIDNVVRNLLANPQVVQILLLDQSPFNNAPQGNSLDALEALLIEGVDDKPYNANRTQISGGLGSLDNELVPYLERLDLVLRRVGSLEKLAFWLTKEPNRNATHTPIYLPPKQPKIPNTEPLIGSTVKGQTVSECWLQILNLIRQHGTVRPLSQNRGYWQEVLDLTTVIYDTEEPAEIPNFMPCDDRGIKQYARQLHQIYPPEGVRYSYGSRLQSWFGVNQLDQVINKLERDPNSASAVCTLWDVGDHDKGGSPCLNHLWFRIADGKLTLTATFRSNDMFNAWPLNAYGLRELQQTVLNFLVYNDIRLGPLITVSQSAHIYQHSWEFADEVVKSNYKSSSYDPIGNFTIHPLGRKVRIELRHPKTEEIVKECTVPISRALDEIPEKFPGITPSHALYLAQEINKLANSTKETYRQS